MSDDLARNVRRLDGTNFQGWKFHVQSVLEATEVFDVVDGTRVKQENADGANAAITRAWNKDNAKAKAIIAASLESAQLDCVIMCTTAREMWVKLCQVHEQKSETNKLILTKRFHEYKMSPTDSVVQHVTKVQNMARQLSDVGEAVSDLTVMAKILASLTTKYSTLITAWDSVDPARQTVDNLLERLIREESRLNVESESVSALAATRKSAQKKGTGTKGEDNQKKRRSKKNIVCYRCQEKGHFASECPTKDKPNDGQGQTKSSCAYVAATSATDGKSRAASDSRYTDPTREQEQQLMRADVRDVWFLDSGASAHITFREDWFAEFRRTRGDSVSLGDNGVCEVTGVGTIRIQRLVDGVWEEGTINDVLLVPNVKKNLFSVGACTVRGFAVNFEDSSVKIKRDGEITTTGVRQTNQIYRLFLRVPKVRKELNVSEKTIKVWHERLGHINGKSLSELVRNGVIEGVTIKDYSKFFCEACQLGKSHKLPFDKPVVKVARKPGEFVHSDVCGPMQTRSLGGAEYFVTFKDDATEFRHVFFMRHKADVLDRFMEYERMLVNKFSRPIKILRADNGTEYCNKKMREYLASKGIVMENTAPYTPAQNGRAERDNRTIVECARTMLQSKKLPLNLWAEAVGAAVYTLNRAGQSGQGGSGTPYEGWMGKKPNLNHMKILGSEAYVHTPKQFVKKFDARSRKMILVGYQGDSNNYRLYDTEKRTVSVSRDVVFHEFVGINDFQEPVSEATIKLPKTDDAEDDEITVDNEDLDETSIEDELDETVIENEDYGGEAVGIAGTSGEAGGNAGGATTAAEKAGHVKASVVKTTKESTQLVTEARTLRNRATIERPKRYQDDTASKQRQANFVEYNIPTTFREAATGPDASKWCEAIKEELKAHEDNCTWTIVPRVSKKRTIDSKWVFKIIRDTDGSVLRFKARLCARGFLQKEGIDYTETFSPVVRYDSLRVLLAVITQEDLEFVQFDVRTAFLYGDLKEDIHMEIPEGLLVGKEESVSVGLVCKLNKSLYGLKQAPRCWNVKFSSVLTKFNLKETDADKCIFFGIYKRFLIYLALFVDDGVIAAKSKEVLRLIVNALSEVFDITLGDCSSFVGLQICRDRSNKSLFIHQRAYTESVIEKFGMKDSKGVSVPADPNVVLYPIESDKELENSVPYREAVGSLMFLAIVSRPDIAYAVNNVSKYLNRHNRSHWQAVKRIFAYLVTTVSVGIEYSASDSKLELVGFSDAEYAGDVETRRSTTGYVFMLANGAVTWSSQRQKMVSMSTTESEYIAASCAARESMWLRSLLNGIGHRCVKPTILHIDNQSTIRLVKNPQFHKRTKHIDVRYHYIREKVENDEIVVEYVRTECQRADMFTKALAKDLFKRMCTSIGLCEE